MKQSAASRKDANLSAELPQSESEDPQRAGARAGDPTEDPTEDPTADPIEALIARARSGDEQALAELFESHRGRLRQLVRVRLDPRLQGRVDASDVLQEAYIDLAQKLPAYSSKDLPFFLWLRLVTGERLLQVHRRHLGAEMRDARREHKRHGGSVPDTQPGSIADALAANITTPSGVAARAELRQQLLTVLNELDPLDREVIVLRHFEELSNKEVAQVLSLSRAAASARYVRAMQRLRDFFP